MEIEFSEMRYFRYTIHSFYPNSTKMWFVQIYFCTLYVHSVKLFLSNIAFWAVQLKFILSSMYTYVYIHRYSHVPTHHTYIKYKCAICMRNLRACMCILNKFSILYIYIYTTIIVYTLIQQNILICTVLVCCVTKFIPQNPPTRNSCAPIREWTVICPNDEEVNSVQVQNAVWYFCIIFVYV